MVMTLYNIYRVFVGLNFLLSDGYDVVKYVQWILSLNYLLLNGYDVV